MRHVRDPSEPTPMADDFGLAEAARSKLVSTTTLSETERQKRLLVEALDALGVSDLLHRDRLSVLIVLAQDPQPGNAVPSCLFVGMITGLAIAAHAAGKPRAEKAFMDLHWQFVNEEMDAH